MLFKIAYDGTKFHGYQRQHHVRTVEGEILRIMERHSLGKTLKSASRTDKGVSALGNVIYIDVDDPEKLIGIMNSSLKDIFFYGFADVDINPRHAKERWYRYHLLDFGYSEKKLNAAARIFVGKHDFKHFTRERERTIMRIDEIKIRKIWNFYAIDFRAQYYLWNVIRRIVAAMSHYAKGNEFDEYVLTEGCNCGIAPPEPLILMDVIYNFQFKKLKIKNRTQEQFFRNFASNLVYSYLAGSMLDYS